MSENSRDPGADLAQAKPRGLIDHYEEIASASRSMLEAAHEGDWAQVAQIEIRCWDMIAALKQAAKTDALSDAEKKRRMTLLRTILSDDALIRLRAEPWLRDLENFLASARQPGKRTP